MVNVENPRNMPRHPPTEERSVVSSRIKYSFFSVMMNSSKLKKSPNEIVSSFIVGKRLRIFEFLWVLLTAAKYSTLLHGFIHASY